MSIRYKVKKKRRNPRDKRITLAAQHQKRMKEFQELQKKIPDMKKKLSNLIDKRDKIKQSNGGFATIQADTGKKLYQLNREIRILQDKINSIESGEAQNQYYGKTAHILYSYFQNIQSVATRHVKTERKMNNNELERYAREFEDGESAKPKKTVMDFFRSPSENSGGTLVSQPEEKKGKGRSKTYTTTKISDFVDMTERFKRADLLEKYTKAVNPREYRPAKRGKKTEIDLCPSCEVEMSLVQSEGMIVCYQCGRTEYIVIDSDKPSYKDPPPEAGEFTYKRINRFDEWLTQYQAKETTEIPQEVLDKILLEMKKERIQNMCCLTMEKVREYLKKLGLNKYYEHIPHIIYCLNGLPTPRFRPDVEEQLRIMFREIQEIFDEVCPEDRTNFLSYSYLLAKLLELLGEDEHKKYFRLHKSREKIYQHDQVWKKICKKLKWQYIRTV